MEAHNCIIPEHHIATRHPCHTVRPTPFLRMRMGPSHTCDFSRKQANLKNMYSTLLPLLLIGCYSACHSHNTFIKKGFSVFEASCAPLHSKFRKCKYEQKTLFSKTQYGYQKTQNFTQISNQLKKFLKNVQKKLLAKTWWKYALFPLLHTFFGAFFETF